MNTFFRIILSITFVITLWALPSLGYASTGKTESSVLIPTVREEKQANESLTWWKLTLTNSGVEKNDNEDTNEEEQIKQDINTYIIESYKAQGTKIIKDLNIKLSKTIPEIKERKIAYEKIKSSLSLRKKRIDIVKTTETKKMILTEFLDHMIELLDKKIEELEK